LGVRDHIPKLNLYFFSSNLTHHFYYLLNSVYDVVYAVVWGKNFVFNKTSIKQGLNLELYQRSTVFHN
jgi:hypothetical protein